MGKKGGKKGGMVISSHEVSAEEKMAIKLKEQQEAEFRTKLELSKQDSQNKPL
jgi:hypothetical protein